MAVLWLRSLMSATRPSQCVLQTKNFPCSVNKKKKTYFFFFFLTWNFIHRCEDGPVCRGVVWRSPRLLVEAEREATRRRVRRLSETQHLGGARLHGQVQQGWRETKSTERLPVTFCHWSDIEHLDRVKEATLEHACCPNWMVFHLFYRKTYPFFTSTVCRA